MRNPEAAGEQFWRFDVSFLRQLSVSRVGGKTLMTPRYA